METVETNRRKPGLFQSKLGHSQKKIERTILIIGFAFFGLLPKFLKVADLDDAPGLMLVGIAVVFIPFAVYTLTSVLENLLEHAILLKTDHDLTV
ncbi:DUF2975 domain-containing protein [Enterococcus lactis]|nr:DUF2975 domain-containing protein [Enterococcus lactis]